MSALSQLNAQNANDKNLQSMQMAMAFNAEEAQKQRDWEEMMSNTAYRRATADMIAAGINPILAAGAAASTPSGATASTNALQSHMANEYTDYETMSQNEGSSWMQSQEYSETKQNLAKQFTGIVEEIGNMIGQIKDHGSAKKISNLIDGIGSKVTRKALGIDKDTKSYINQTLGNKAFNR